MSIQTADRFAWQGRYDQHMATAWERDGYLILDDFVSPEDVARMRARADSLIEDFDIEAHRVVFSAKGQSHAASDYFMKSAANISFFLEEEAVDEDGRLLKTRAAPSTRSGMRCMISIRSLPTFRTMPISRSCHAGSAWPIRCCCNRW